MTPELRALIERWSKFAELHFARTGEMRAMWYAETAEGEGFVIEPPPVEKDLATDMIRVLFRAAGAVRCVFIDEAWSVVAMGEAEMAKVHAHQQAGGDLETYPGRIEVITFLAEDQNAMLGARRVIERPSGGKAYLGPLQFNELGGMTSGRFAGMLPRPKKMDS